MTLALSVRTARETDIPFVMATWLENYSSNSPWAKRISPRDAFFKGHRPLVEELLRRPAMRLFIAADPEDDDTFYGWLACEPGYDSRHIVHYSYVKKPFRNAGVFKALLGAAGIDLDSTTCTHWTYNCSALAQNHSLSFNPYLVWETK